MFANKRHQRGLDTVAFNRGESDNEVEHLGQNEPNFAGTLRNILGDDLAITNAPRNLDLRRGLDHASTGIPYSIHGTATIVNQRVAYALATYQDPIKGVLGMAMHKEQKVVIRRKFVVGGHAMITPEHAQARTVAIREEEIEYVMARYGSDIFMNLNLFLKPDEAKEELDMKLDAQIAALQQEQCRIAYDMLMKQGTRLVDSLARTSVANTGTDSAERLKKANDTYVHAIFGAMSRFEHPLSNLLAMAQQANAFDGVQYDTLLAPAGMLPLEMYTPEHSVKYAITGVPTSDKKPITVGVENMTRDPRTGLKIGIVQPFPDSASAQSPYASAKGGGLTNEVTVGTYYVFPGGAAKKTYRIPNMESRGWDVITTDADVGAAKSQIAMRFHKCVMSSAILAKSGSDTGEMLFAWPHTGISTSQTTETMKMQLRAYFGAVLYKREHIMILPDIHCERVLESERPGTARLSSTPLTLTADKCAEVCGPLVYDKLLEEDGAALGGANTAAHTAAVALATNYDWKKDSQAKDIDVLYPGRIEILTTDSGWQVYQENQGHLGNLENPANPAAYGQFVYNNMRAR